MRRASLAFALLALAPAALAQANQTARLGLSVNAYYFTEGRVRDALGEPALTYGLSAASLNRPRENKLSFAYNIVSAAKDDSRLFLLPVTVGYEKQFAPRRSSTLPYARVEAGFAYYDVALHDGDYDKSFKTGGAVGAAEVGVIFNGSLGLKGRYNLFQERFGVDLSGFEVGLTYTFGGF